MWSGLSGGLRKRPGGGGSSSQGGRDTKGSLGRQEANKTVTRLPDFNQPPTEESRKATVSSACSEARVEAGRQGGASHQRRPSQLRPKAFPPVSSPLTAEPPASAADTGFSRGRERARPRPPPPPSVWAATPSVLCFHTHGHVAVAPLSDARQRCPLRLDLGIINHGCGDQGALQSGPSSPGCPCLHPPTALSSFTTCNCSTINGGGEGCVCVWGVERQKKANMSFPPFLTLHVSPCCLLS